MLVRRLSSNDCREAMSDNTITYVLGAGMGLVAGMRSMSAPALLSRHLARHPSAGGGMLASRRAAHTTALLAAGEAVADKMPGVPARTEVPALLGRAAAGALCAAAVADRRGGSRWGAALAGAVAAVASAHVSYRLRKEAGERSGVPDPVWAVAEDALVVWSGSRVAAAVG